ncbi:hypothetical protein LSTR_LSTR006826 [Laodelphax striatellus]|uniref:mRNA-capping enzyme n=1 Tax=Laodelphax striatellus TaxID=195883 RepID=A0A482XEL5_LAOST|nr:hypothetical protein LSTR_LSTR006826 [Laodelphax striatellus]
MFHSAQNMSGSSGDPGPIPKRWLKCPRKAVKLMGDKFLAFKTPLSDKFDCKVPEECRFPPRMLISSMNSYKVRIGMWIDLTNTDRFYDKDEIRDAYGEDSIKYIKLQCRGHGETPNVEQTNLFINICRKFISSRPLEMIGVHCTHGFNRTGFLLVAFMIEEYNTSVEAALRQFADCRPPGIYKQDYLNELFARYGDVEDTPAAPTLPNWCYEDEDQNDDGDRYVHKNSHRHHHHHHSKSHNDRNSGSRHNRDGGPPAKKPRKDSFVKNPVFMSGVPGVHPIRDQSKMNDILSLIKRMCKFEKLGFPGGQPVSMDIDNMHLLKIKPYRVSWKADGTRYMMLISRETEVYFVDRDNSIFQVDGLKFLMRNSQRHLTNTLLDGEMVIEKVQGTTFPRYLIYDVIQFNGNDVSQKSFFPDRLGIIEKEIIMPRTDAMKKGIIDRSLEPFSVRLKQFYPVSAAASLLGEKFARQLSHEPDGLIFQPSKEPYIAGKCTSVLKWKPASHNSVDFKLCLKKEEGMGIVPRTIPFLYVGGLDVPFSQMKFSSELRPLDGKIIECRFDQSINSWVLMRERTDKSYANSHDTALAVIKSIRSPVTKDYLLSFIETQRFRDEDSEMMPPPPPHMAGGGHHRR